MKAQVFSHDKLIGTTELYLGDESMGCLYGNFIPTENYYKYILRTVWDFWSKTKPDYDRWAAMKFNVQLDNGYFLFVLQMFSTNAPLFICKKHPFLQTFLFSFIKKAVFYKRSYFHL
ncbi:hypothetical protein [Pedobacter frigoris]|uniref:hypothetical protein n=1 Tax=Pedobacter frigoris TaxID=2571272 RepID=UPI002930A21A|nr:hypothetical protein [Pedobacter frigoris]